MEHQNNNGTEATSTANGDGSRAAAIRAAFASHEEEEASLPPTPTVTEPASQVSSQDQNSKASAPQHAEAPPSKRFKGAADTPDQQQHHPQPETPVILTESATPRKHKNDDKEDDADGIVASLPQTPMPVVERQYTDSGADAESSSDLSSSSRGRDGSMSPINTVFVPEVPPAPPSTPASQVQTPSNRFDGLSTPLPYTSLKNAYYLEQQQQLADGGVTPAPPRPAPPPKKAEPPASARPTNKQLQQPPLSDDFTEWAVGKRYQLLRILGRGSYGQVAQAVDLQQGRPDAFVAIKRIQSPFDQQIDAVRLFREIHILRRLRGHECIIQLLDVVQPPSEDLDDFNDLYLVFECKLEEKIYIIYSMNDDGCYR